MITNNLNPQESLLMFKKSDYFILAAVMLSFLVSAFQWFVH